MYQVFIGGKIDGEDLEKGHKNLWEKTQENTCIN